MSLTAGQVENWVWERTSDHEGRVPKISRAERDRWAELGRQTWLTPEEAGVRAALQDKIRYRNNKIRLSGKSSD